MTDPAAPPFVETVDTLKAANGVLQQNLSKATATIAALTQKQAGAPDRLAYYLAHRPASKRRRS